MKRPFNLQDLKPGVNVEGLSPDGPSEIINISPSVIDENDKSVVVTVFFKRPDGSLKEKLLSRDDEQKLQIVEDFSFPYDSDPAQYRLATEANRIQLAHHFDPYLAINTSRIEPFPHQITAVYEKMLPKHPLRFILADDPGAGKTIMSGLLIKELIARGDLERCLIVAPGILVEQWQDELLDKFGLDFEILTTDTGKNKRNNNPFLNQTHLIARLDMLSRNDRLLTKLQNSGDWDLIVVDEAHKMSAHYNGGEIQRTKRYRLGEELEKLTRHLLMMTATPHNGREGDFHLFMSLIDGDRFAGRYRRDAESVELSDIMRRLTKEELLQFDGTPLFPERIARTVLFNLSEEEMELYDDVTHYVQNEMERVERFVNRDYRQKYVVGFALQLLQRRLASSPNAIYQSLKRRHERLKKQLIQAEHTSTRQKEKYDFYEANDYGINDDNIDDIDDEDFEDEDTHNDRELISEMATTAETIGELKAEVSRIGTLVDQAQNVLNSGNDTKWIKLREILNDEVMIETDGTQRKLIVFTEARDTLSYLQKRIVEHIGDENSVAVIHGGVAREERHKIISRFMQDKNLKILVANDAAGEGVNLQRAYLMVNYDLPWNPNKIEQRFGRIHRIGQTETCYLWNLVAADTREGDVYGRLLEKLENVRTSLKGHVFDVLGELFEDTSLKQLLLEAIQHGSDPARKKEIIRQVDSVASEDHIRELLNKRKLSKDFISSAEVEAVRMDKERADAQRLQPYHVESFFINAFTHLNGAVKKREHGRYEVEYVPSSIRKRAKAGAFGGYVPERYERICFERKYINQKPDAEFIVPGHPLLETVIKLIHEQYFKYLKNGAIMVDDLDYSDNLRTVFLMEHSIEDGRKTLSDKPQIISQQLQFIQITKDGRVGDTGNAPHLDLRPVRPEELEFVEADLNDKWHTTNLVKEVRDFSIKEIVMPRLKKIKQKRLAEIEKIEGEVTARLTREIEHWESQADRLEEQEKQGRDTRLPSQNARRRASALKERLETRLEILEQERTITTATPIVRGAFLVIPKGLIIRQRPTEPDAESEVNPEQELRLQEKAMNAVINSEEASGFKPEVAKKQHSGYDIISFDSETKSYRFIKVKSYVEGTKDIYASRNEIITSLNKPDSYWLAVVKFDGNDHSEPIYVPNPFNIDPKFTYTIYPFDIETLLAKASKLFP